MGIDPVNKVAIKVSSNMEPQELSILDLDLLNKSLNHEYIIVEFKINFNSPSLIPESLLKNH
jgi:hypothetical protein